MAKILLYISLIVCSFILSSIDTRACVGNLFFTVSLPQNWEEGQCIHGTDKFSDALGLSNEFRPKAENLRYQYAYAIVLNKEVDLKDYIYKHVTEFEKTTPFENLCYFKQENFHGYNAISYTFAGKSKNVNCTGKIYAFHANGYTFIFASKFIPNKSGLRNEVDIWEGLKWLPAKDWRLQ